MYSAVSSSQNKGAEMRPVHGLLAFSAAILLISSAGCEDPQYVAAKRQSDFSERTVYYKDERVGLCYAYVVCSTSDDAKEFPCRQLTWVPCDPVKDFLPTTSKASPAGEQQEALKDGAAQIQGVATTAEDRMYIFLFMVGVFTVTLGATWSTVAYLRRRARAKEKKKAEEPK